MEKKRNELEATALDLPDQAKAWYQMKDEVAQLEKHMEKYGVRGFHLSRLGSGGQSWRGRGPAALGAAKSQPLVSRPRSTCYTRGGWDLGALRGEPLAHTGEKASETDGENESLYCPMNGDFFSSLVFATVAHSALYQLGIGLAMRFAARGERSGLGRDVAGLSSSDAHR